MSRKWAKRNVEKSSVVAGSGDRKLTAGSKSGALRRRDGELGREGGKRD
jgi:hypothetical protein